MSDSIASAPESRLKNSGSYTPVEHFRLLSLLLSARIHNNTRLECIPPISFLTTENGTLCVSVHVCCRFEKPLTKKWDYPGA